MKRTPLQRKTPLRAKTPLERTKPMARPRAKRRAKRSPNEFPDAAKRAMRARSGGRCEVGFNVCTGDAAVFHHRKARASKDQRPVNGLHLCDACHRHAHHNVTKARLMGVIVPSWEDPATVPVIRGDRGR